MDQKRFAQREIMRATPALQFDYNKIINCSFHRPCNRDGCDYCSGGKPHRHTHKDSQFIYDQRADPKQARGKSKNYRSRAGDWMVKPFLGFPEHQCHPFTIDFYIEDRHMDGIETTRRERTKFQSLIKQEMPHAVVRIICDISACWISTQYLFMPDDSVHPRYRDKNRPSEFGFNFHGHGIIYHPTFNRKQIATKLRDFYPGEGRVCFSTPLPETQTPDGYLTGGLQGWGEYAGMEKTEVDLPSHDLHNDNYEAVRSMLLIRKKWRRSARKIVFNDRTKNVPNLQQQPSEPINITPPSIEPDDEFLDISHGAKAPITSNTPNLAQ